MGYSIIHLICFLETILDSGHTHFQQLNKLHLKRNELSTMKANTVIEYMYLIEKNTASPVFKQHLKTHLCSFSKRINIERFIFILE